MNRIYQGRVTKVDIPNPEDKQRPWKELTDWPEALWHHHQLFQDAVNYYTLALAAMADGLTPDNPQGTAILGWRSQVRENWPNSRRKALRYDGPHQRLAAWLGVDPKISDEHTAFETSAKAILNPSGSTPAQRAGALLQLLQEAASTDPEPVVRGLAAVSLPRSKPAYQPVETLLD